jgi:SnoaL-like domain
VLELPRGTQPWGTRYEGKQAVRSGLATRFEGLPDVHYGNEQHFVDNTASTGISKWLLTGTTPEGVKVQVQGCDFYTFDEVGRVTGKDSSWKIVE